MRIDWHIHTVLSPCASLHMSPARILAEAAVKGLDAIGICDHNSTRQVRLMLTEPEEQPVSILPGVELCSMEDIHFLAFFDDVQALDAMQEIIDCYLPDIRNNPLRFGDQVVVDRSGKIRYIEEKLLIGALNLSVDEMIQRISECNGLVIPAHANKPSFSLLSQLGFVPKELYADAYEIWGEGSSLLSDRPWVCGSDAHHPQQIGTRYTASGEMDCQVETWRLFFRGQKNGKLIS